MQNQNQTQTPKPKKKYSALSVLLAIIFFVVLVMLGERAIFDLNRFLNPVVDKDYTQTKNQPYTQNHRRGFDLEMPKSISNSPQMLSESSGIGAKTRIYYKASEKGRYLMWKLIIHSAVIIPLFILAFVLFSLKKGNAKVMPLVVSYMIFAWWMMLHLLGETISFVKNSYPNASIYIILILLVAIFGGLAYYVQAKYGKNQEEK